MDRSVVAASAARYIASHLNHLHAMTRDCIKGERKIGSNSKPSCDLRPLPSSFNQDIHQVFGLDSAFRQRFSLALRHLGMQGASRWPSSSVLAEEVVVITCAQPRESLGCST